MRERLGNILRCFAVSLADAALSALLIALMLSLYDYERTYLPAVYLWALLLLIQAAANELLASRNASMLVFSGVNIALLLFTRHHVLAQTVFTPASNGFPVFWGILIVLGGIHAAYCTQHLPTSDLLVRMADALIAAIGVYMASAFALSRAFNLPVLAFALAALTLVLITVAALRAGGESDSVVRGTGIGGWLVLGALFVFCLLVTAALLGLGSGHVDSLVGVISMLWSAITAFLQRMLELLALFLALFALPVTMQQQSVYADPVTVEMGDMEAAGHAPEWLLYIFFAAIIVLILAAVVLLIWALHRTKFSRTRTASRKRRVTRKSHFFSALLALVRRIAQTAAFEINYFLHRRTPQGVLIFAQRHGRMHRLPRRASESGGAYLRRLHAALQMQGVSSTLDQAADALDLLFYGGTDPRLTTKQAEDCLRQIRQLHAPAKPKEAAEGAP